MIRTWDVPGTTASSASGIAAVDLERVLQPHHVVVRGDDQGAGLHLRELGDVEARLLERHPHDLLGHHRVVLGPVGRHLGVAPRLRALHDARHGRRQVVAEQVGQQAVAVELAADHHHPAHQVRAAQRDVQRRGRAVAEADEVRGTADHLLQERDRVGGDALEVHRPVDVRGAAVATPVRCVHPEPGGVLRTDRVQLVGVAEPAVQVHQRVAGAVDRVPGAQAAEVDRRLHDAGP